MTAPRCQDCNQLVAEKQDLRDKLRGAYAANAEHRWLDDGGPMKTPIQSPANPDMDLWPRIKQAIDAAGVGRADVMVNLPSCHRKNCQQGHGDIDLVFRMFAKAISDSIYTELLCKATSEPDDGSEVVV